MPRPGPRRRSPPSAICWSRRRELEALHVTADEWTSLGQAQSRLAHAAALLEAAAAGEDELADSDAASCAASVR